MPGRGGLAEVWGWLWDLPADDGNAGGVVRFVGYPGLGLRFGTKAITSIPVANG